VVPEFTLSPNFPERRFWITSELPTILTQASPSSNSILGSE
jgi:hypothetical protein